ncbi:MAG: MFS transporter, partial [Spirochaetia bacterium]
MAGQNEKSRFSTVLIPLIVIPAVFLGLISFFGYLDSTGLYSRLLNEKIAVTGRSSADMINNSLASAQDLAGYNGFAAAAGRLLQEEQSVRLVKITDADNKTVYEQEQAAGERDLPFSEEFQQTRFEPDERGYTVTQNPTAFLLSFPLHNQSRVLGSLRLIVPKAAASLTAGHTYLYIWLGCGAAVLLFTLLLVLFLRGVSGGTKTGIGFIWVLLFLALAGYSGYSMYEQAGTLVHEKLESTKASLVQDIKSSFTENADAAFLRTTQNIFNRYQKADPDIAFISLTGDAGELVHTPDEENPVQAKADDTYAVFSADVPLTSADTNRTLTVNLGVNNLLVPEKLLQQYINLLILLVTSIVLSLCLLNLFWAARRGPAQTDRAPAHAEFVPPLFFLIVFSEALVVWLMPSFIQKTVVSAGLNQNLVPLLFSVYFAGFWISLLPSRLVAKRTRVKGLLIIGALCAAAGYFVLAFFNEYYYVILSRGLAGIGHGMIISGLCSLSADTEKRSSYAFYAYAGGMAAGICFGSLLGSYIPLMYIFIIAGGLAGFKLLYNLLFFPASLKQNNEAREEAPAEPLPKRVLLT